MTVALSPRQAQRRLVTNLQRCAGHLAGAGLLPAEHRAFLAGLGVDPTQVGIADRLDKERHVLDAMGPDGGAF